MILSTDRMNRLPFHLDRWHEPMSIVIQCNENELSSISTYITSISRSNIRFTFYVIKNDTSDIRKCSFISRNMTTIYSEFCYPLNELRDLSIETIKTSHFLILDGDALITSMNRLDIIIKIATLEINYKKFIPLISNEKEILLIPLFYYMVDSHITCREKGNCTQAYTIF